MTSWTNDPRQILEVSYTVTRYFALPKNIDLEKEHFDWYIDEFHKDLHIRDKRTGDYKNPIKQILGENEDMNDSIKNKDFTSIIHTQGKPTFDEKLKSLKRIFGEDGKILKDWDCTEESDEDDVNRDIPTFLLFFNDCIQWSPQGQMRRATEEDVKKWGDLCPRSNLYPGKFISVVNEHSFSTNPLYKV